MLLNAIPNYHPSTIRIPGVLQRIALCYAVAAILFWKTSLRIQAAVAAAALIGYWLAMMYIPVPGCCGAGTLTREGSLASFVDRWLLGSRIYRQGDYDPEGLLSTIPAVATALLGMFSGLWLKSGRTAKEKLKGMTAAGTTCLLAGWVWSFWFPLNKALWTSSYALYTGGLALWLFSLCYWVADVKGYVAWGRPLAALGRNAIAAYVLPILLLKFTLLWHVAGTGDTPQQLKVYLCEHMFGGWLSPTSASAAYALSYMLVWLKFFSMLERKGIHIKV